MGEAEPVKEIETETKQKIQVKETKASKKTKYKAKRTVILSESEDEECDAVQIECVEIAMNEEVKEEEYELHAVDDEEAEESALGSVELNGSRKRSYAETD